MQQFSRITTDPEVMGGKPCIRGMRVTVGMIVEALAAGRSIENLLDDFPYLDDQDIREALAYALVSRRGGNFLLRVDAPADRYEPHSPVGLGIGRRRSRGAPLVRGWGSCGVRRSPSR